MDNRIIQQAVNQNLQNQKPLQVSNEVDLLKTAFNSPKLSSLDYNEVKGLIKIVMAMVGLKPTEIANMSEPEKQLIVEFIQNKFGGHTAKEFINAFTMALAGELDVDAECYQNFSIAYIGRIMSAFRKWAAIVYKENRTQFEKPKEMNNQLPTTECDWTETWEALKNGESAIIPAPVFSWAEKKGYINLTVAEKNELVAKAQSNLAFMAGTLNLPDEQVKELRKRYKNPKDILVLNEAKKIAVREALNKLLKN
jgi:hypothetical protein